MYLLKDVLSLYGTSFPFPRGDQFDGCITAYNSAGVTEKVFGDVIVVLQCYQIWSEV